MLYVWCNFWTACRENWPEFFLFLGVIACGFGGFSIVMRLVFGLSDGPEVPAIVLFCAYLWWAHKVNLKKQAI